MGTKALYLYVAEGFADWEPAFALAAIRGEGGWRVETVAETLEPVTSMGGLRVLPSYTFETLDYSDIALLLLPGGNFWVNQPLDSKVAAMIGKADEQDIPLAAICGATVGVARAGVLRGRRHTSNMPGFLKMFVPDYAGEGTYEDAPAVRDQGLITASGLAAIEFAREILAELDVFDEETRQAWAAMNRTMTIPPGWFDV